MYPAHRTSNGTLAPRVQPRHTPHHHNHPNFAPPAHTPQGAADPCHGLAHPSHSVSPSQVHTAGGGTAGEVTARTCTTHGTYPDAGAPFLQPPRWTHPPRRARHARPPGGVQARHHVPALLHVHGQGGAACADWTACQPCLGTQPARGTTCCFSTQTTIQKTKIRQAAKEKSALPKKQKIGG